MEWTASALIAVPFLMTSGMLDTSGALHMQSTIASPVTVENPTRLSHMALMK